MAGVTVENNFVPHSISLWASAVMPLQLHIYHTKKTLSTCASNPQTCGRESVSHLQPLLVPAAISSKRMIPNELLLFYASMIYITSYILAATIQQIQRIAWRKW